MLEKVYETKLDDDYSSGRLAINGIIVVIISFFVSFENILWSALFLCLGILCFTLEWLISKAKQVVFYKQALKIGSRFILFTDIEEICYQQSKNYYGSIGFIPVFRLKNKKQIVVKKLSMILSKAKNGKKS